jgi:hypothetical protein
MNFFVQYGQCRLAKLKKYGPSLKTLYLSSILAKMAMKNPWTLALDPLSL